MSSGSDYQKLRAHLAFRRMGAAAEALPGLLDETATAKLTNQAFLERLLAVEVDAVDERRRASLSRFASLPSPFTLADFDLASSLHRESPNRVSVRSARPALRRCLE